VHVIITQNFLLQYFTTLHKIPPTGVASLHQPSIPFDLGSLISSINNQTDISINQTHLNSSQVNLFVFLPETKHSLIFPSSNCSPPPVHSVFFTTSIHPDVTSQQQQTLDKWTMHRPFHSGISTQDPITSVPHPNNPRSTYTVHLLPYGTAIKPVNHTETLCICFQNTQFAFQLYHGDIKMQQIIQNLINLEIGMFVPISLNKNWENTSNWNCTRQLFHGISCQVHLAATSRPIGKDTNYFNKSLISGSAILTFGFWSSKVAKTFQDPSGHGTYILSLPSKV